MDSKAPDSRFHKRGEKGVATETLEVLISKPTANSVRTMSGGVALADVLKKLNGAP